MDTFTQLDLNTPVSSLLARVGCPHWSKLPKTTAWGSPWASMTVRKLAIEYHGQHLKSIGVQGQNLQSAEATLEFLLGLAARLAQTDPARVDARNRQARQRYEAYLRAKAEARRREEEAEARLRELERQRDDLELLIAATLAAVTAALLTGNLLLALALLLIVAVLMDQLEAIS